MIAFSTIIANVAGDIIIQEQPNSNINDLSARVNRIATLDGACVIVHSGYTDADRMINVNAQISEAQRIILQALFETESSLYISTLYGFFSGSIQTFKADNGELSLTFLVRERQA